LYGLRRLGIRSPVRKHDTLRRRHPGDGVNHPQGAEADDLLRVVAEPHSC
jgi:hypothetical protein